MSTKTSKRYYWTLTIPKKNWAKAKRFAATLFADFRQTELPGELLEFNFKRKADKEAFAEALENHIADTKTYIPAQEKK